MSKFTDSREEGLGPGIMVLQDPNYAQRGIPKDRLDERRCILAVRVKNVQITGEGIGHYEYDQGGGEFEIADMVGSLFWPAESRSISGVSFAWPAVMGGDASGGPGQTRAQPGARQGRQTAGASFEGVRSNFSSGSAEAGASFSGVRQNFSNGSPRAGAEFTDPTPGPDANSSTYGFAPNRPPPGTQTAPWQNPNNEPAGPAENQPAGGGAAAPQQPEGGKNTCGTMPNSMAQMLPVGTSWKADTRYKQLKANMPDIWPKFPKGTFGIALPASDETKQEELFFPVFPNLMAINKAGDPKLGSMVCDANDDFEIDRDRTSRLQSMMWVVKKPLGGENGIAWNLNESGCEDHVGGWVIDKPDSGTPASPPPPGRAAPGAGGTVAGPATGANSGRANGPGQTQTENKKERVIARSSVKHGGPFDVGTGKCKHVVGKDDDGNSIVMLHWSTKTLFRKNDSEDGPILFEDYYPNPDKQPYNVPAHLGWDDGSQMWRFWAEIPFQLITATHNPIWPLPGLTQPTDRPATATQTPLWPVGTTGLHEENHLTSPGVISGPGTSGAPNPPLPPPTPGGNTGQPPTPGTEPGGFTRPPTYEELRKLLEEVEKAGTGESQSVGPTSNQTRQSIVATPLALGAAAFASFAQEYTAGKPNLMNPSTAAAAGPNPLNLVPVSGMMSSYSAQGGTVSTGYGYGNTNIPGTGDPRVYTQKPGESKFRGGTASGGWVFHPPETGPEDIDKWGMVPPGITRSSTYVVTAPGAYFGAGIPALANGGIKDGLIWGVESASGDLVFSSVYQGSTPIETFRIVLASGNIRWTSNGLASTVFYGEFEHANTANRTYTFPDKSGTVALTSDVVAGDVGAKASDQSWNSDTTLANVTDMAVAVGANETWAIMVQLDVGNSLHTTGAKLAITVPSGATLNVQATFLGNSPTTSLCYGLRTTTSGAALDFLSSKFTSANSECRVTMMVYVATSSTAGNVQLQAAQSTLTAQNMTIRTGSFMFGLKQ